MAEERHETIPDGDFKFFEAKRLVDVLLARLTVGQFMKLYRFMNAPQGAERLSVIMEAGLTLKKGQKEHDEWQSTR